MRGDCVGGSSSSIEAVERGEADEADEASTGTFSIVDLMTRKTVDFNVNLTAEVNRAGDGQRVSDPVGDEIHQGIQGGHYGTPGTVARRVPVPRSQLHRLVADCIELVDGRLRLAGKASETLRSSSYLPSSSGWHG